MYNYTEHYHKGQCYVYNTTSLSMIRKCKIIILDAVFKLSLSMSCLFLSKDIDIATRNVYITTFNKDVNYEKAITTSEIHYLVHLSIVIGLQ